MTLSNAICLSYLIDINLKRSGMSSTAMAIAESAAAAQRLRRETEKGIRFRRSAGRVLHARRVAKCMNIGWYCAYVIFRITQDFIMIDNLTSL